MNNIFPAINGHSRSPSEDLRAVQANTSVDMHSASKSQQVRRQQQHNLEQNRRTPLRSSSLLPSTGARYVTAAAAAAAAVGPPTTSGSPLLRSPSFVQTGSSAQFEPAKIVYRSTDFAWNDHPNGSNPNLRAASPLKNKISGSARQLSNGNVAESVGPTGTNSTTQVTTSVSPTGYPSTLRDDMNNVDLLLNATSKSRPTIRVQRTNSHIDKVPGQTGHALPIRSESYRSSRHDYGIRPRHTSPKQRNYISSKTSFYDLNTGEFYLNGNQDENLYLQQQQSLANGQVRVNGSAFDLTASRKPLTAYKSNTFHVAANGLNSQIYQNSSHDFYRSETNLDRNLQTRGAGRNGKEIVGSPSKTRQTHSQSNTPADRQGSPNSYKSRDANDSYAYTNVKKYIEENDLMSPEKEQLIRNWVIDVERYRHQLQKVD